VYISLGTSRQPSGRILFQVDFNIVLFNHYAKAAPPLSRIVFHIFEVPVHPATRK
jgi:hypothetical protein